MAITAWSVCFVLEQLDLRRNRLEIRLNFGNVLAGVGDRRGGRLRFLSEVCFESGNGLLDFSENQMNVLNGVVDETSIRLEFLRDFRDLPLGVLHLRLEIGMRLLDLALHRVRLVPQRRVHLFELAPLLRLRIRHRSLHGLLDNRLHERRLHVVLRKRRLNVRFESGCFFANRFHVLDFLVRRVHSCTDIIVLRRIRRGLLRQLRRQSLKPVVHFYLHRKPSIVRVLPEFQYGLRSQQFILVYLHRQLVRDPLEPRHRLI